MMDKAMYIGMGGQTNALKELEILTNNLANVNTPGFRGDYEVMKQNHIQKGGMESRVYSSLGNSYTDFKQGPILRTGRDLDIAVSGKGMIAIQSNTGKECYTRAGNLDISADGILTTSTGEMVLGRSGVIRVANAEKVNIADDGTVSIKIRGTNEITTVGKIKLALIEGSKVEKGKDGNFYGKNGQTFPDDANLKVTTGTLEGSNVNPVETLIKLIDISRNYEIHSNFIKNLSEQAISSNKLLDVK
jgi:flagellar basal-body rod protein FlgF